MAKKSLKNPKGAGRKPTDKMDWKVFNAMLQRGTSIDACASILGISRKTIERYCKKEKKMTPHEYAKTQVEVTATKLKEKCIDMALKKDGNFQALRFALMNMSDWTDKQKVEGEHNLNGTLNVHATIVDLIEENDDNE